MFEARLWSFIADMNGDGIVTIGDVWLWVKWLYFYPGDGIFHMLMFHAQGLATFFEISPASYGGVGAAVISFFIWLVVLVAMGAQESSAARAK